MVKKPPKPRTRELITHSNNERTKSESPVAIKIYQPVDYIQQQSTGKENFMMHHNERHYSKLKRRISSGFSALKAG